eukprot:1183379-Prorocentrum_minimum.AAC.1
MYYVLTLLLVAVSVQGRVVEASVDPRLRGAVWLWVPYEGEEYYQLQVEIAKCLPVVQANFLSAAQYYHKELDIRHLDIICDNTTYIHTLLSSIPFGCIPSFNPGIWIPTPEPTPGSADPLNLAMAYQSP